MMLMNDLFMFAASPNCYSYCRNSLQNNMRDRDDSPMILANDTDSTWISIKTILIYKLDIIQWSAICVSASKKRAIGQRLFKLI